MTATPSDQSESALWWKVQSQLQPWLSVLCFRNTVLGCALSRSRKPFANSLFPRIPTDTLSVDDTVVVHFEAYRNKLGYKLSFCICMILLKRTTYISLTDQRRSLSTLL